MRITKIFQILLFAVCATIAFGTRIRRQIVFEDDEDRRDRSPNSDCTTPGRRSGQCVRWTTCPALRGINNWNRLQPHVCGFAGSEPRVCCPLGEEDERNGGGGTTRRPPTRRTPTTTRGTVPTRRTPTTTRGTVPTRRTPTTTRGTVPRRETTTTTTRGTTTTRRSTNDDAKPRFLPESCGVSLFARPRVVGGQEAERGGWPWMAVVFVEKRNGNMSPDCGGALVTSRHVITAAHCVVSGRGSTTMRPQQLRVRLGAHDLRQNNEPDAVEVGVDAIRRHEQFDPRTYKNDIAVLRLARPVPFTVNNISPVCLPYDSLRDNDLTSKTSTVTGFGTTSFNGAASDVLMEVSFDITDQEECRKAYERELNITDVYLCAGTADGSKDSCQGDSGGPLVTVGKEQHYYLVGVVSFGKLCAQPGYPGVYTRVTKYLDWLRTNLAD